MIMTFQCYMRKLICLKDKINEYIHNIKIHITIILQTFFPLEVAFKERN